MRCGACEFFVNVFGAFDTGGGFAWTKHAIGRCGFAYDHIGHGGDTLNYGGVGGTSSFRDLVSRDFDIVLLGINSRFGGPAVARD